MKVILLNAKRLTYLDLPNTIEGSFWISNPDNPEKILINVESRENNWYLIGNNDNKIIVGNEFVSEQPILANNFYTFGNPKEQYTIYVVDNYDKTMKLYKINENTEIKIGNGMADNISYAINYLTANYAILSYNNGQWSLVIDNAKTIYLNNDRVIKNKTLLKNGDTVFIMGLIITVTSNMVIMNNPQSKVTIKNLNLSEVTVTADNYEYDEVPEINYYKDEDYFFKTPRLRRFISTFEFKVAAPPTPDKEEELPFILLLGPMLTMGMTSAVSLLNVMIKLNNGETTLGESWMTLVIAIAMMTTTLLWPNLTKKYKKKQKAKKEAERRTKYSIYLEKKKKLLNIENSNQRQILIENLLNLNDCYDIIKNRKRTLWERKISQQDFLTVKVGTGNLPLDANINFNEDEFIIDEDDLKKQTEEVINTYKTLGSVPVGYSFFNQKVTAIMGIDNKVDSFINNVILQLLTFHSYDDLKIVVFTDEKNIGLWEYLKIIPHSFSNDKQIRFFTTNDEEEKKVSAYLEQEFIKRTAEASRDKVENESAENKTTYLPYYLILTDDFLSIRKLGITELIMNSKENYGFGFMIKENKLGKLPSECETFINIGSNKSTILCNSIDNSYQHEFNDEINDSYDMFDCSKILANIPIEFEFDYRNLPNSLSFLEMYNVGKMEQLNVVNRWRLNDPTKSLRSIIGVNDTENKIYLDLHEKNHGPHGLIAGTTGSGKSEFIITYILSMAVNYSPNEVAFILIDYKGGGLAGAFENKKNNVRLPHLSGTITNLDKNELNRTLVSIDSELKRRQERFNNARDELGESTMDIYKYQKFFREKKLKEPIPHLFIICDEFAELKSQQPEFMDNLISAARIGRSLGVHLILATQKPSGVVNDQIWSNTKFRVCLKVQDKADSNEMIKCPDAAEITNAGRFYLQVGYNEIFILGQSGWGGASYIPKDNVSKEIDRSLMFIDNTGEIFKTVDEGNNKMKVESKGDELSNILKYITTIANREQVMANQLWLENIPETIYVEETMNKYKFSKEPGKVSAIIGAYDDPSRQHQNILTLDFDDEGNTIIYGLSGVGREMFIKSILYSCSINYSTEDINFYIFDFGSESLRIFSKLPHVGDIVFSSESEKVEKMLLLINQEIVYRKELFADYNGDYFTYCKNSGKKVPIYSVIFNNYDSFKESYTQYDELINKIVREGKRYGILVILTASSQSGLFGKFTRNFSNVFVLDMNDKSDYMNILGKIGNVLPSDYTGRGLYKKEIAYEFQTAKICDDDKLIEFIKEKAILLSTINKYTPVKVPVLPDKLSLNMLIDKEVTLKNIPIGMSRNTLEVYNYNFKQDKATIITSNDTENCLEFTKNLLKAFKLYKPIIPIIIDTDEILLTIKNDCKYYYNKDLDDVIKNLSVFVDEKIKDAPYELVIFIAGLEKFKLTTNASEFNKFIDKIKLIENVSLILIDSSFKLKKFVFESWFTNVVVNANGIWIGSGIMEQTVIKLADIDKRYKEKIKNDFSWVFKNSNGTLIKLINDEEETTNEE
ncbi:MAG: type VII secretion protein EssC [Mycoplasmatota bacterium]